MTAADANSEDQLHADGARLVLAAFAEARDSGREDWRRMTVAVLKNRILRLTGGSFTEATWGAETFREFVERYPDVVSIDASTQPPTAELLGDLPDHLELPSWSPSLPESVQRSDRRVRSDLWDAVLDYSGGRAYVWDADEAVAVPIEELSKDDPRPRLPTVDRETLALWRRQFAEKHLEDVPADLAATISAWRDEGRTSHALPTPVRRAWNGELKARVVERLDKWFRENGIAPPSPVVRTTGPANAKGDTEALRDMVIRCVKVMTRSELDELRLPPSVLLRARR